MEMTASPRQQFLAWLEDQSFFNSIVISDEAALMRQAEEKVLTLFHQAAANVPAYNAFLKKSGVYPADIRTMDDFRQLPLTDKENWGYSIDSSYHYILYKHFLLLTVSIID
jgi:phenylacetate-coenzyme A ligase PaaK-like adenylate-forming protein